MVIFCQIVVAKIAGEILRSVDGVDDDRVGQALRD